MCAYACSVLVCAQCVCVCVCVTPLYEDQCHYKIVSNSELLGLMEGAWEGWVGLIEGGRGGIEGGRS